jgi:hypothetical protein
VLQMADVMTSHLFMSSSTILRGEMHIQQQFPKFALFRVQASLLSICKSENYGNIVQNVRLKEVIANL